MSNDAHVSPRLSTLQGEWHEMETKREREKKRKREEEGGGGEIHLG